MKRIINLLIAISFIAVLLSGCSHVKEIVPIKIAVVSFSVPEDSANVKEIQGWWFSARDVYRNQNLGELYADAVAEELKQSPYFDVYPRTDLKYYFAKKKERLKKEYPDLTIEEVDKILSEISMTDVAKEIGVDKLITGEITTAYMSHQRTIHWWKSVVAAKMRVVDGKTGAVEWEMSKKTKKNLLSQLSTAEINAHKMLKKMKKKYR